jgi:hypothetical protein
MKHLRNVDFLFCALTLEALVTLKANTIMVLANLAMQLQRLTGFTHSTQAHLAFGFQASHLGAGLHFSFLCAVLMLHAF